MLLRRLTRQQPLRQQQPQRHLCSTARGRRRCRTSLSVPHVRPTRSRPMALLTAAAAVMAALAQQLALTLELAACTTLVRSSQACTLASSCIVAPARYESIYMYV